MTKQVIIDFETRSEADLKKVGAVKYAQHPTTEAYCMAYKFDAEPTKLWTPKDPFPLEIVRAARHTETTFVAHNAGFEQAIFEHNFRVFDIKKLNLPPERWRCTAAKAAAHALPRAMEGAALVLGLPIQKNMDGNRLVKKFMKPTRKWLNWVERGCDPASEPAKWHSDELELWAIHDYCITDVEVTYALDRALPNLIDEEQAAWVLNQYQNQRGIQVDHSTVVKIISMMKHHSARLQKRVAQLTDGEVTSALQRDALINWMNQNRGTGDPSKNLMFDLRAATVSDNLANNPHLPKKTRELLEIRQTLSKTSTKKYPAIVLRTCADGRVKDLSMYHGASTGREAGTGLQLQNLPKGKVKNTALAIECIEMCETGADVQWIEALYGDPMEVFSSCVRGMVQATPGWQLFAADYSAIEARVLAWYADWAIGLERFRKGLDPYVYMAADIYGVSLATITAAMRQLGKTAELGCGYQMGAPKFHKTCMDWGVRDAKGEPISLELATKAVKAYRESHGPIVRSWGLTEKAAIYVVQNPTKRVKLNKCIWGMDKGFLWCKLPSGRKLSYYGPTVRNEPAPWGQLMPKLYHWGVDPNTKRWVNSATYGGRLVENLIQGIARDICVSGMLKADKAGYKFLFMVHDEVVAERQKPNGTVQEFSKLITTLPEWAKGLPITAGGWAGPRYKKG